MKLMHKISKAYPCTYPECDFVAKGRDELERHECKHTGETPFACDRKGCDFVGKHKRDLSYHKSMSHKSGAPRFKCDFCGKMYDMLCRLRAHKLGEHSIGMPFKCELCDKGFKYKIQYNRHQKEFHSGVDAFDCSYEGCGLQFSTFSLR